MLFPRLLLPASDRHLADRFAPRVLSPSGSASADEAVARLIDAAGGLPGALVRFASPDARHAPLVESLLARGEAAICWPAVGSAGIDLAVFKPGCTLSRAWTWTVELAARLGPPDAPLSFGLAADISTATAAELAHRAQTALRLAGATPGRIYTWEMARVEAAAAEIGADASLTPEGRRRRLLERIAFTLGPTQREHLTSHCERVGLLSARLASWLGQKEPQVEQARLAGLLHDIGKAEIPEELLAKPAALTPIEREVVAYHAEAGGVLGDKLGLSPRLSASIRHHHERFDAATQPAPLREDGPPAVADTPTLRLGRMRPELTPEAIVGVADAFVAMTTDRAYRPACSAGAAIEELRRHRGRQFHPVVVDAAIEMLGAPAIPVAA